MFVLVFLFGLQRKKGGGVRGGVKQYDKEWKKPKPVDEDLYKIPPELLYKMPKKASSLSKIINGASS